MKTYNNYFGKYGGRYVPEVLRGTLDELEEAYNDAMSDGSFMDEFAYLSKTFIGRPTPLVRADNVTKKIGGASVYVKLEGLANTGAHKINNALGQALLAKKMGKKRVIAETGAGQHGVATASACAKLSIDCVIYMGEVDIARQRPNVFCMEMFGAEVRAVKSGSRTLKDAVNEAMRDWASNPLDTYYILGSVLGPSPFPDMVREFQSVIGREVKKQAEEESLDVKALIACVGGGSNSIGFFSEYLESDTPRLIGVEAGGRGRGRGEHAARMTGEGKEGIVQGYKSRFLLDDDGQVLPTHSISAGLDYPGIGPQLAMLGESGRIEFTSATDAEALEALKLFAREEGLIFALESAHAASAAVKIAKEYKSSEAVIVNMSGRGDKDIFISAMELDRKNWSAFLESEIRRGTGIK
ncbi:MAG: tryptophan synthase subunit beta [Spirochaetia bacterium]|nr:tryptophan synthase subunit beta [Spirochaetia bacterium]